MKVSPKEVAKIATLARLQISDDKLEAFAGQFNDILDYMDLLGQADTEGVEPLYSPVDPTPRMRKDEVKNEYTREEVLGNCPETDGNYFIVPKIV